MFLVGGFEIKILGLEMVEIFFVLMLILVVVEEKGMSSVVVIVMYVG